MTRAHPERMSSVDTAWLRTDSPVSSMVILSVTVTETPIPPGGAEVLGLTLGRVRLGFALVDR